MFRKAIIFAAASLALTGTASAGLVGTAPAGFSFSETWTHFQGSTEGRTTSDLKNLFAAGDPDPVDPGSNASIDRLRDETLKAGLSGVGTLKTGSKLANVGRHAVDDNGQELVDGAFIDPGTNPNTFMIKFDAAVRAFAFWGTDIGDFPETCGNSCSGGPAFSVILSLNGVELFRDRFHIEWVIL